MNPFLLSKIVKKHTISDPMGKELKIEEIPSLKEIIQLSHKTLKGTYKLRQHLVYGDHEYCTLKLPQILEDMPLLQYYKQDKKVSFQRFRFIRSVSLQIKTLWKKPKCFGRQT